MDILNYLLQLLIPFTAHVLVVVFILVLIVRWFWVRLLFTALALFLGYQVYTSMGPLYSSNPQVAKNHIDLRVFQLNLNNHNQNLNGLIQHLKAHRYDLIVLQEVTSEHACLIENELKTLYPSIFSKPENTPFGAMILSRHKIAHAERQAISGSNTPYSYLVFKIPELKTHLDIYEIHAFPPLSEDMVKERAKALMGLARIIQRNPHTVKIILGDLNLTPYNPLFRAFAQKAGLATVRSHEGTWPYYFSGLFRIPIDHALATPNIEKIQSQVLKYDFGSDHAAIVTSFALIPRE